MSCVPDLSALKGKDYVRKYECDVVKRGSFWVGMCRAGLGRGSALQASESLELEGAPRELGAQTDSTAAGQRQ